MLLMGFDMKNLFLHLVLCLMQSAWEWLSIRCWALSWSMCLVFSCSEGSDVMRSDDGRSRLQSACCGDRFSWSRCCWGGKVCEHSLRTIGWPEEVWCKQ